MYPLLVLIVSQTFIQHAAAKNMESDALISLIADFVSYQKFPTKITSFLCFNRFRTMHLFKTINLRKFTFNMHEKFPNRKQAIYQLFLLDLNCNDYSFVLEQAEMNRMFDNPYKWLIINNTINNTLPKNLSILTDSQFFITSKISESEYNLKAIYKFLKTDEKFLTNDVAIWTQTDGFRYFNRLIPPRDRNNIMGTKIKISFVITHLDSLNHLWDYRDKHIDGVSKVNYVLSNFLVDILNGSKENIMQRSWGYLNKTTSMYDGMFGELQAGRADIGSTPAFFTEDRLSFIDFIDATTPTRMKFIFRAPPLSYVTNVFTLPFDTLVWYGSYIMISVIFIVLYIIVWWEWKDPEFQEKLLSFKHETLKANPTDVLMLEIGAITQQGSYVEPRSLAGRIATIISFLILMFMYTSYSANVVALLQSTTNSFKTLDDLLYSRIKLGVEDIIYARYYFSIAEEPIRKAIYEQKIVPKGQPTNFMQVSEGIKRMQEEFFAFHVELSTGYKVVSDTFQEDQKCSLKEIEFVRLKEPWISIQKNSSFKEIMKVGMRKLHESGVQNREVFRVYTKKPLCQNKGSNFVSVGLIDCYFPFVLFGAGSAIAFIILIVEKIMKRFLPKGRVAFLNINEKFHFFEHDSSNETTTMEFTN